MTTPAVPLANRNAVHLPRAQRRASALGPPTPDADHAWWCVVVRRLGADGEKPDDVFLGHESGADKVFAQLFDRAACPLLGPTADHRRVQLATDVLESSCLQCPDEVGRRSSRRRRPCRRGLRTSAGSVRRAGRDPVGSCSAPVPPPSVRRSRRPRRAPNHLGARLRADEPAPRRDRRRARRPLERAPRRRRRPPEHRTAGCGHAPRGWYGHECR